MITKHPTATVRAADLKSALSGLGKLVPRTPSLAVLGCVKVEAAGPQSLRLTTTDIDFTLSVTVPATVERASRPSSCRWCACARWSPACAPTKSCRSVRHQGPTRRRVPRDPPGPHPGPDLAGARRHQPAAGLRLCLERPHPRGPAQCLPRHERHGEKATASSAPTVGTSSRAIPCTCP